MVRRLNLGESGAASVDFVRAAAALLDPDVEVYGELGRSPEGTVALLGRERTSGSLVALRLRACAEEPGAYDVDILSELDRSLPEIASDCTRCGRRLRGWTRFCPFCGADLSGVAVMRSGRSREELLELVKKSTAGRYRILGEMGRVDGEGLLYFAVDPADGRLVALRLLENSSTRDRRKRPDRRVRDRRSGAERRAKRPDDPRADPYAEDRPQAEEYSIGLTRLFNPLEGDIGP